MQYLEKVTPRWMHCMGKPWPGFEDRPQAFQRQDDESPYEHLVICSKRLITLTPTPTYLFTTRAKAKNAMTNIHQMPRPKILNKCKIWENMGKNILLIKSKKTIRRVI